MKCIMRNIALLVLLSVIPVSRAQGDCSTLTDCSSCVSQVLADSNSTTCQWFSNGQYCASSCDGNDCGVTTRPTNDTDALCHGLACNFCLDLNCSWAPGVGCVASCNAVETNCLEGSQYEAEDVCGDNAVGMCDGLECEVCLGVGSCAWVPQEGCVSSCGDIANARCFPGGESVEADVCGTASANNNTCDGLSCEKCLDEPCGWAPGVGCISCSVFDMDCFPGEVYSAYEVCTAENSATPSSEYTSLGGKVSIVVAVTVSLIVNVVLVY